MLCFRKRYSKFVEYNLNIPKLLDKDNVGLIVVLESLANESLVCVATTHLLFSAKKSDTRLAQTAMLLAELDKIAWIGESNCYWSYIIPKFPLQKVS